MFISGLFLCMHRDCGIPVLRNPSNNPILVSVCPGGAEFVMGVRFQAIPPGPCPVGPRDVRAVSIAIFARGWWSDAESDGWWTELGGSPVG